MRTFLPLTAVLLSACGGVAAAATPAFEPGATVWTVAGGGTQRPAEGRLAVDVNLGDIYDLAALPDGGFVVARSTLDDDSGMPVHVDPRGVVHPLRGVDSFVVATGADGTIYTADGGRLLRWDAGSRRWVAVVELSGDEAVRTTSISDLEVAPDGTVFVLGGTGGGAERIVAVARDGRARRLAALPLPGGLRPSALAALPDGRVAARELGKPEVVAIAPDGAVAPYASAAVPGGRMASTADGGLVVGGPQLAHVPPAGGAPVQVGDRRGARDGRGQAAERTRFEDLGVAVLADGSVLTAGFRTVRLVTGAGGARLLAALLPETRSLLARGRAAFTATGPGRWTIAVRVGERTLRTSGETTAGGEARVALDTPPPQGDATVTLTLTGPDGRTTTSSLRALTWRVLPLSVAQKLASAAAGGRASECDESSCPFDRARDCRRTAPLSVTCRRMRFDVGERPRCLGRILVRARPTGYDVTRSSRCPRTSSQ